MKIIVIFTKIKKPIIFNDIKNRNFARFFGKTFFFFLFSPTVDR